MVRVRDPLSITQANAPTLCVCQSQRRLLEPCHGRMNVGTSGLSLGSTRNLACTSIQESGKDAKRGENLNFIEQRRRIHILVGTGAHSTSSLRCFLCRSGLSLTVFAQEPFHNLHADTQPRQLKCSSVATCFAALDSRSLWWQQLATSARYVHVADAALLSDRNVKT
jgi:hypothetical protein